MIGIGPKFNTWSDTSRMFAWSGMNLPVQWDKSWSRNVSQTFWSNLLVKSIIKRGALRNKSAITVLQHEPVSPKEGESDCNCCRKGDSFHGPKVGSCLTLGNELSEEMHVLTKQEILLGKGAQERAVRVREPRRTALPRSVRFYGDGISFRIVFSQSS